MRSRYQRSGKEKKQEESRSMERMILLSSIFRSKKSLSKGVEQLEAEICSETPRGFQGEEDCSETFMRFQEKEADMGIPPSREDQDLRSPI